MPEEIDALRNEVAALRGIVSRIATDRRGDAIPLDEVCREYLAASVTTGRRLLKNDSGFLACFRRSAPGVSGRWIGSRRLIEEWLEAAR